MLELLRRAIAHANEQEPLPARRRAVVLFWLKLEVREQRRAFNYSAAFRAMTLIRLLETEDTINPIWKALVAVSKEETPGAPPTTNRGVRSSAEPQSAPIKPGNAQQPSSAIDEADQTSYSVLADFVGHARR
jgi:hypothetical protein